MLGTSSRNSSGYYLAAFRNIFFKFFYFFVIYVFDFFYTEMTNLRPTLAAFTVKI